MSTLYALRSTLGIAILSLLSISLNGQSQTNLGCGGGTSTFAHIPRLCTYHDLPTQYYDEETPIFIRVYVHQVVDDNGMNGQPISEIEIGLENMFAPFEHHNIFFVWDCVIEPTYSSECLYEANPNMNILLSADGGLPHDDGIDIYIFPETPPGSPLNYYGGGTHQNIPADFIGIGGNDPITGLSAMHTGIMAHDTGQIVSSNRFVEKFVWVSETQPDGINIYRIFNESGVSYSGTIVLSR